MFHKIAVVALVTLGMPAVANAMPQTQDEWFVDSGRYLNGQIVSYDQPPAYRHVVASADTGFRSTKGRIVMRSGRITLHEGRASAYVSQSGFYGTADTSREGLIHAF